MLSSPSDNPFIVETLFKKFLKFVSDISKGLVPVVFSRGNHDTRGELAEKFADFFPANNKKTYYSFDLGCLGGVVLDCGEDKLDNHEEYGGVNVFEKYRMDETLFLKELPKKNTLSFAVSHICPSQTTQCKEDIFNIEKDTYTIKMPCKITEYFLEIGIVPSFLKLLDVY